MVLPPPKSDKQPPLHNPEVRSLGKYSYMPSANAQDKSDPLFIAILDLIKPWNISAPAFFEGSRPGDEKLAKLILDTVKGAVLSTKKK